MVSKTFEMIIKFFEVQDQDGNSIWLPLVNVTLITPSNSRISLSLLFDTGASVTTLRADLYPILGLQSWDQGERLEVGTAGGASVAYKYNASFEIFGKTLNCPVHLMQLPPNPLYHGVLGRDNVFFEFGFGFWESTNELYVTTNP